MKIRFGFVSNSSSSSFCIVGVVADEDDFDKEKLLQCIEKDGWNVEKEASFYEMLGELCGCTIENLTIQRGLGNYSCDDRIVGRSIRKMKDDETLGDFKMGTFELLKKIGYCGKQENLDIIVDGGYEG